MVGGRGIEPLTPSMSRKCSPAELTARRRPRFSFARLSRSRPGLVTGLRSNVRLELHPVRTLKPERRARFGRRRDLEAELFDDAADLGHLLGITFGELARPDIERSSRPTRMLPPIMAALVPKFI